ncbi:MAG: cellobiose phosphorylase, partial [Burkholderiaceae bacterium]|nr:cellobiose phosphorylase [Burkholderiaceae bacterium]
MNEAPPESPPSPVDGAAYILHDRHAVGTHPPRPVPVWSKLPALGDWLDAALAAARTTEPEGASAAEWLLDNDYQVRRALLQIAEDLPPSFYRRLPALSGSDKDGLPRVFALAHGLLQSTHLQLSLTSAVAFVNAYQDRSPLTIAELWAFPTMLRLVCLEVLTSAFSSLFPDVEPPAAPSPCAAASICLDDNECVARALSNLAVISTIQWKDFFDATSRVEEILRGDPAGVYARMDFGTRDAYRHVVEEMALESSKAEWLVAADLLAHCRAQEGGEALDHVGYWLVGKGRPAFEATLKARVPPSVMIARMMRRHAGTLYGGSLVLASFAGLVLPALYLAAAGATLPVLILGITLAALPATVLGVTFVNWIATLTVAPSTLPKLDFTETIAPDCLTAVVVPVLVGDPSEVPALARRLESHFLANPDPALQFVLLSDLPDAGAENVPGDEAIEKALVGAVEVLNARYGGSEGKGPFRLMHRSRRFNAAEGCWMGWERKRGKLEEFNAFALTGDIAPFTVTAGQVEALRGIRYVVTADADTRLPPCSVNLLVGTLAHPLNVARFNPGTGRVRSGYTILQPRVEIAPENVARSPFTRLFAGDMAIDIYSRAVSDVYQDLFGTGIFVGKGIYDVAAFTRSLEGRIPENAVLSHDLIEGLHGKAALVSDVIVYEGFPSGYLDHARRWHRWVRGDWQLLPWLFPYVPGRAGARLTNRLMLLDRWKITDNLRRSLVPISLVALALAGWFLLPGSPWAWTVLTIAAPGAYLFTDLVTGLARGRRRRGVVQSTMRRLRDHAGRWALAVVFLVNDALIATDAILRTLWRLASRRRLLEWTSAAHMAARFSGGDARIAAWREMWPSPAFALLTGLTLALANPASLLPASPLLLLWLLAPEIAAFASRARPAPVEEIGEADRAWLRRVARRSWLFFETFVRPEDNWLPPDNYQEPPHEEIARRTSPTNIGMMMLAALTAWKLGHIGLSELATRFANVLDALDRLERHRGHILNWYETHTLRPLEPRYVSTVDSGNLAVSLIVVKEALAEAAVGPALGAQLWHGLRDGLDLLGEALDGCEVAGDHECRSILRAMAESAREAEGLPDRWEGALDELSERLRRELEPAVQDAIARGESLPARALREVQLWLERTRHHLAGMRRDLDALSPWRTIAAAPAAGREDDARRVGQLLPPDLAFTQVEEACLQARALLAAPTACGKETDARRWADDMERALAGMAETHRHLAVRLEAIASRAAALAHGMDFRFLYDRATRLFHIGYNVSAERIDQHHYDLLATEARLASYFAIAKGDVPLSHWFHLARPITKTVAGLSLVSWNGSMFEYLMPTLFLRSEPSTLLGQTERTAVDIQRGHGRVHRVPWGISESGYASRDPEMRYRYRAFGAPGLGLRRGLARDMVVAPYATLLALPVSPAAALANLRALEALGMVGTYGFYEAVDFTPERVPEGQDFAIVRSWMAHHHGMSLAALGNALSCDMMVEWFHRDNHVRTVDLLLNERIPWELPEEITHEESFEAEVLRAERLPALHPWVPSAPVEPPQLHAIGNGRLTSLLTSAGGGGLSWHRQALTRFSPGTDLAADGYHIHVRDLDGGEPWRIGAAGEVVFHQHKAEFQHHQDGLAATMTVSVVPGDDLELRRIAIVNETPERRRVAVTSHAEIVLAPPEEDRRHPAFSKLFVGAEHLAAMDALLFARRPRSAGERPPVLLHRVLADDAGLAGPVGFETDRAAFLGRYGRPDRPAALMSETLPGHVGWTLDPIAALQVHVDLDPYERRELAFVTVAAGSRETAVETAERYTTLSALDWAVNDAATQAARTAHALGIEPSWLPDIQMLLSVLLRPRPPMRIPFAALAANRLGQQDLWALGISGDHPMLLLRADDGEAGDLLRVLVGAHLLWRGHGVVTDLVVLQTGSSGYVAPMREQLVEMLHHAGAHEMLGRDGGIHLVTADQTGAAHVRLVEAAAHVVLDAAAGPLSRQLVTLEADVAESPRFEATAPTGHAPPCAPRLPDDIMLQNGFGGFAEGGEEYVIRADPADPTPAPWANVLANDGFGTIVTEAGLGWTWALNSGESRLTPWHNDPVADPQSEALYLRDEESAAVWTPTPLPAGNACLVRHGAGYTLWQGAAEGLEQDLAVFVPVDDPVKLVRLRLKNPERRPRRVTAAYCAEWLLSAVKGRANPLLCADYDAGSHALMAQNRWNGEFAGRVAFLTSTLPPHSLTTSRSDFLGQDSDP